MSVIPQREALSAYIDGHHVDANFAETLCNDTELQQKWADYHTVRDIMRGETVLLGDDFSAKVAAAIEREEMDKYSNAEEKQGLVLKLKRWSVPLLQVGIAASVCLAVVFGVQFSTSNDEVAQAEQPVLQTLPFSNDVRQVSYNAPAKTQPTEEQLEYQQRRINALLQNHELQRRAHAGAVTLTEEDKAKSQTSETQPVIVVPQNAQ